MVNTFLTDSDFNLSAKKLDRARLGKQRCEAYQILLLIQDLERFSILFNHPLPSDPYKWKLWIREILNIYKNTRKYLFYHQNKWTWIDRSKKPLKIKFGKNTNIMIRGDKIIINGEVYNKYEVILPGDRLVLLGFVTHPCVLMWLGHKEALMEYIDAHISEFINRGYKNTMKIYNIKAKNYPEWIYKTEIHDNHKAALLTKEITRNEPIWYNEFDDFIKSYNKYKELDLNQNKNQNKKSSSGFNHYIWPYN